ncbi:MAG: DevR family CRISPR-associated autoregulator [Candidatus Poribacteria bacterium]|jgi:CRISPR-associated protein Cst2|nr:DevR family CRISPR-associated autoregulator [Candidatus Poribacteria bacterium]MDP6751199.1 DevR family CRISPR-associated autoregulator [Candidatus Poribacteria bacterium]
MKLWSMSISFRLGLGFHALNNEGSDGSNLMQPRRIDVGDVTYDGISGEIVRRHILENLVQICQQQSLPLLPMSAGLHPDRGPLGIRAAAKINNEEAPLDTSNLYASVRTAIERCTLLDIGGFLAAFGGEEAKDSEYTVEQDYIDNHCAKLGAGNPVKRESCFDVGWLISEQAQDLTITQHSAYRDTAKLNSRYSQTMRSNTYGGVIRAELHRIGTDDHWYLSDQKRLAIEDQAKRQQALIKSIIDFIAAPTGARTAAWAPHVYLTEGVVLLSSNRTAPFTSPIKVDLDHKGDEEHQPVSANPDYRSSMSSLANQSDTWAWTFDDVNQLINLTDQLANTLTDN